MINVPTDRKPTPPGEMLLEEFLKPLQVSQQTLADALHVPFQRINEIIHGRRRVTPSTALRLSKYLGTTPGYWMNLQLRCDLYEAEQEEARVIEEIKPFHPVH